MNNLQCTLAGRPNVAEPVRAPIPLADADLERVTAGAWWGWMALGAAATIVLLSHTDVIGETGHGCRGIDCNNLP